MKFEQFKKRYYQMKGILPLDARIETVENEILALDDIQYNMGMDKVLDELWGEMERNPIEFVKKAIYGDNKKIAGIPSLIFEIAPNCSSNRLGFCGVCDVCYALKDFKHYEGHRNRTINCAKAVDLFINDNRAFDVFVNVLKYLEVDILRFNLVGDFRGSSDVMFLMKLHRKMPELKLYGYSKRYDLKHTISRLVKRNNCFIGLPSDLAQEVEGANSFQPTNSVKEWHKSTLKCLGNCEKCRKCFTLKNRFISCFVHGSPSHIQKRINTKENYSYCVDFFNRRLGLEIQAPTDKAKGLFYQALNKDLEGQGIATPYTVTERGNKSYDLRTVKDLFKYVEFLREMGEL